jgi:voltage-gated potassium channel
MDRMNFTVNWKLVSKVPLFKKLDATHIADIVSLLTPKIIPANYAILKLGEKAQSMYFIVSGQLEVHLSDGSVILESGDFFGEMAILNDTVRNANVFSKTECKLLELKSEQLKYLMNMHPELNSKIEYIINARHENIK